MAMVGNDCGGAWLAWYMVMSAIMIIASFSLEVEQAVLGSEEITSSTTTLVNK